MLELTCNEETLHDWLFRGQYVCSTSLSQYIFETANTLLLFTRSENNALWEVVAGMAFMQEPTRPRIVYEVLAANVDNRIREFLGRPVLNDYRLVYTRTRDALDNAAILRNMEAYEARLYLADFCEKLLFEPLRQGLQLRRTLMLKAILTHFLRSTFLSRLGGWDAMAHETVKRLDDFLQSELTLLENIGKLHAKVKSTGGTTW